MEPKDIRPEDAGDITPVPADAPTDDKKALEELRAKLEAEAKARQEEAARADRNYARAKKAEERLRERGELPDDPRPTPPPKESVDPFSLAKTVSTLKDLDEAEIDFLATLSKATGKNPAELKETTEFKMYLAGKREEDTRSKKIPTPGGSAPSFALPTNEEIAKMPLSELAALEKKVQERNNNRGGM